MAANLKITGGFTFSDADVHVGYSLDLEDKLVEVDGVGYGKVFAWNLTLVINKTSTFGPMLMAHLFKKPYFFSFALRPNLNDKPRMRKL